MATKQGNIKFNSKFESLASPVRYRFPASTLPNRAEKQIPFRDNISVTAAARSGIRRLALISSWRAEEVLKDPKLFIEVG
jgi:hypothetical protein